MNKPSYSFRQSPQMIERRSSTINVRSSSGLITLVVMTLYMMQPDHYCYFLSYYNRTSASKYDANKIPAYERGNDYVCLLAGERPDLV